MDQALLEAARSVAAMLERLSADSIYAHRASGLRGSLLKAIEWVESGAASPQAASGLERLVRDGYAILENAAREIRAREK